MKINTLLYWLVVPSFAERIKLAIDTLRTKAHYDDGKVKLKLTKEE